MTELLINKHVKYFLMCLKVLPTRLQKEDSNKLMIIYCCIGGLSILKYEFPDKERTEIIEFIYEHLVETGEGFRGSMTHKIPGGYDPPTVANTYCALSILSMLQDDYSAKLDKFKIMEYLTKCQCDDGSFKSVLDINGDPFGDGDSRQTYMVCCIRKMLDYDSDAFDIDLDKIEQNILGQFCFDGGLGIGESHAGYTFCGLTSLKLIGRLEPESLDKTLDWLAHRQIDFNEYNQELLDTAFGDEIDIGSHNGRDNKFGDTCYSFWTIGSLKLFNKETFINKDKTMNYLLNITQNKILGGFAKSDADDPDPYHSFLALAALSIITNQDLEPIDSLLSITFKASNFISNIYK